MVRFTFSGHELLALPQGALFWPARKALLVADLHLEKASWFARFGQMLPPYDSIATLADLTALQASTGAAEIWCLGDSFHDSKGCDRLPAKARALLTALTGSTRWTWITRASGFPSVFNSFISLPQRRFARSFLRAPGMRPRRHEDGGAAQVNGS